MSIVLNVDSADPGRFAANPAPRLAALLMDSFQRKEPVQVTAHAANASVALASVFSPADPLSQWVEQIRAEQAPAPESEPVLPLVQPTLASNAAQGEAVPAPGFSAPSPIAAIYRRLLGEMGPVSRLRAADELLEAARPAPAGETAAAARQTVEAQADRTTELLRLAAVVVAAGFGVPAVGLSDGGEFEASVLRNVGLAADVVAPGKALSRLSPIELQAIVTATMHSSTGAFISQFGSTPRAGAIPRLVTDTLKAVADAGKVAEQFSEQGKFSQTKFLQAAAGMDIHPSQVLAATPVGLKMALIRIAAQKAVVIVEQARRGIRDQLVEHRMKPFLSGAKPADTQREAPEDEESLEYENAPKPFGV